MSLGYHNVQLHIENYSGVPMRFENLVYRHGMIDDYSEWPTVISHNSSVDIKSVERKWSVLGVSGYAVYDMSGTKVGIAFSCPPFVAGKVNVATGGGSSVWDDMTDRGSEFAVKIKVGHSTPLNVLCERSHGWVTTNLSVKIYPDRD
ncbi:uncharacterized protein LOC135821141 [Sycon ciliatum]|uniref:uncharacterized protein LOC135821141 n=1 Tax=Sycon ciliatum TaxID=27933 RepID=UPI0020A840D1|eukprot:scpid53234/ scgid23214/ 